MAGPVGAGRDAATVAALLRRALRSDYLRRFTLVLVTTSVGVAAAVLVHLLVVDGTRALPASVLAALLFGVLFGVPVGACLLLVAEVAGLVADLARLALAHRRQRRGPGAVAAPEPVPSPERDVTPEQAPAVAERPAPAPQLATLEAGWAERWAAALREPDARPQDVDPTVARVVPGSVLEVQDDDGSGALAVRRMRALRGACRNGRVGGVGVWAVSESAWQLYLTTGHPVPATRVWAELVVTVDADAAVDSEREG